MKLNEKIRFMRRQKNLTIRQLHEHIVKLYEESALSYWTLSNIECGKYHDMHPSSIEQIMAGLGVTLPELFDGVERETLEVKPLIRRTKRSGGYKSADGKVRYEIITPNDLDYWIIEYTVEPGHKTSPGKVISYADSIETVYVVSGKVVCHVGESQYPLQKGDTFTFDNHQTFYYENIFNKKAIFIVYQNPKKID
ncbi:MAG: XRE family transcriptional regulator [Candidatus Omnitrophica bacterium]|nr:XRE family transcriptional regulator [Candidatus Omnitrophota bacterium]MBU1852356.1 XRE family transcriptional regulator [Candidatus Omnitrophota bacterium]